MEEIEAIIKNVLVNYIKSHNETAGTVIELMKHINETVQCAQSLPANVQADLQKMLFIAFAANGISINRNI